MSDPYNDVAGDVDVVIQALERPCVSTACNGNYLRGIVPRVDVLGVKTPPRVRALVALPGG